MEKLFDEFKNMLVVYRKYQGHICGYNDAHFIIAVETKDDKNFFRKIENPTIMDEYKDVKYRYIFADESDILKQIKNGYNKTITKD
jgi:hypothetical protein